MTDGQEETVHETMSVPPPVGEQLRAAREQKKLTVAEVAAQLRLIKGHIELLEQGKWSQLHGRAYARGYFVNYVKFLGLPQEDMLAAFDREYEVVNEAVRTEVASKQQRRLPAVFMVLLAGLLVAGWLTYPQWQSAIQAGTEQVASTPSATQLQAEASAVQPDGDITAEPEPATVQSVVEPVDVMNNDTLSDAASQTAQQTMQSEEAGAVLSETDEAAQQNEASLPAGLTEAASEISATALPQSVQADTSHTEMPAVSRQTEVETETAAKVAAPPQLVLELSFSDDCWVKITDATGNTLLIKTMPANSRQTVTGQPPFKISLGRSSAVAMKVNGQPFDMTPYQKHEVVHFTVEQAET